MVRVLSIKQQAELLDYLLGRTQNVDGREAKETLFLLEHDQVDDLRVLATRLHRMAPHEDAIRQMVTGR